MVSMNGLLLSTYVDSALGAIIVSTPQDLALRDAVRGIDLFKKVNVPILGMIQNMSTFTCTNCGHDHDIFGLDGMLPRLKLVHSSANL